MNPMGSPPGLYAKLHYVQTWLSGSYRATWPYFHLVSEYKHMQKVVSSMEGCSYDAPYLPDLLRGGIVVLYYAAIPLPVKATI